MEDKTSPATIHPEDYGARRCFIVESQHAHSDNTSKISFGLQFNESNASPKGQQRKDTHWQNLIQIF